MRVAFALVVVSAVSLACSGAEPPSAAVEHAAQNLYASLPLGEREAERMALRSQGTQRLQGVMESMDVECDNMASSTLPNHGLPGDVAEFSRRCFDLCPLSCAMGPATLTSIAVGSMVGDIANAVATVKARADDRSIDVALRFRVVDGAWKIDEARCPP